MKNSWNPKRIAYKSYMNIIVWTVDVCGLCLMCINDNKSNILMFFCLVQTCVRTDVAVESTSTLLNVSNLLTAAAHTQPTRNAMKVLLLALIDAFNVRIYCHNSWNTLTRYTHYQMASIPIHPYPIIIIIIFSQTQKPLKYCPD